MFFFVPRTRLNDFCGNAHPKEPRAQNVINGADREEGIFCRKV